LGRRRDFASGSKLLQDFSIRFSLRLFSTTMSIPYPTPLVIFRSLKFNNKISKV
jgi:hypothetical protein